MGFYLSTPRSIENLEILINNVEIMEHDPEIVENLEISINNAHG